MQTERKKTDFLWILYIPAYFITFFLLERRTDVDFHIIHCGLDDKIPFLEFFIIPYYIWFIYVFLVVALFFLKDIVGFRKLIWFLTLGMTTFLVVSAVYPNGLNLRPETFPRDNFFTNLVKYLYSTDTSTNVLPSIHVYNSICVYIAVAKSNAGKKHKGINILCLVLSTLIILSTMFLKQHSVIDVVTAGMMAVVYYILVYHERKRK